MTDDKGKKSYATLEEFQQLVEDEFGDVTIAGFKLRQATNLTGSDRDKMRDLYKQFEALAKDGEKVEAGEMSFLDLDANAIRIRREMVTLASGPNAEFEKWLNGLGDGPANRVYQLWSGVTEPGEDSGSATSSQSTETPSPLTSDASTN